MPATRPPLVGVTSRHADPAWNARWTQNYLDRLAEAGAQAVLLAPDAPAALPDGTTFAPDDAGRLPDALLDRLDGLILAGGGDVHPDYFGDVLNGADEAGIDRRRDEMELALSRGALARDLPLFGICRGCQVLNVAAGGALVQHFDGHRADPSDPTFHAVRVAEGSRLHALVGAAALQVNTYHHQGVDPMRLAPAFTPAAVDAEAGWLIEAFESASHRWLLGVQWHPERTFELPAAHRRLWESFIDACNNK